MASRRGKWLLWGYGPLLVLIIAFVLMVTLVPSTASTGTTAAGAGTTPATTTSSDGIPTAAGVSPCVAGTDTPQVPGDGYSPPCIKYSGDNGGATAPGVTGSTITVTYRITADAASLEQLLAEYGGAAASFLGNASTIEHTLDVLTQYFNQHFQFYGRKIKLVPYNGQGSLTAEALNGGQANADADGITAAQTDHAFADFSALSQPYAEALSREHVVNIGAPYLSQQWFEQRYPYAWSNTPDCDQMAVTGDTFALRQLVNRPATYAGGDLKGKTRKLAILYPDNPEYTQCADYSLSLFKAHGYTPAEFLAYTLNISTLSTQAVTVAAKLAADHITSVACYCDPLFPIYLTKQAADLHYYPEWLVTGTAYTDTDVAGQLYDQSEWSHAFGGTALGIQPTVAESEASKAYASVAPPGDTPSSNVIPLYYQLYPLAIGLQMAGPDLTPTTFARGMRAYPGGVGQEGAWSFAPDHFSPQRALQEIYWDPTATSALDGKKGAYEPSTPFYLVDQVPTKPATKGTPYTGPPLAGIKVSQLSSSSPPSGNNASGGSS